MLIKLKYPIKQLPWSCSLVWIMTVLYISTKTVPCIFPWEVTKKFHSP